MNIAHFGVYKPESANGVNKVIASLSKEQARHGNQVYIYSLDLNEDEIVNENKEGINIVHFKKLENKGFKLPKKFIEYIKNNKDNIDIIHLHSVYMPENCMLAKLVKKVGIRYIVTPHGGYNSKGIKKDIKSNIKKLVFDTLFEKKMLKEAFKIHALTHNEQACISAKVKNSNIFIQPNGIDKHYIDSLIDLNEDYLEKYNLVYKKYIVYCGRLDIQHKGIDLLIKSYSEAKRKKYIDKKLLIIGPTNDEKLINKINKLVDDNNISEDVIFTGALYGKEKINLIRNAAFFIQCSRWEGLPMGILEALTLRLPIVATKSTNLDYWFGRYEFGEIVEVEVNSIIEAIKNVNENIMYSQYITDIEEKATEMVTKEFNWEKISGMIVNEYKL